MSKTPFLPLFFGDFLASTAEWTGEERSLYLILLGYQWSLGSLPADPDRIRLLCNFDKKNFARLWPVVSEKFTEESGRLHNTRLEEHRVKASALSVKNSNSGSRGAAGKWGESSTDSAATRGKRLSEARAKATHTKEEWALMLAICGPACLRCGSTSSLVKDHIVPIYAGGSDGIENLQPLCKSCNCAKGPDQTDHRPEDWRERLANVWRTSGANGHKRLAEIEDLSGNPSHPIPSHISSLRSEGRERPRPKGQKRCPEGFEPDLDFARREVPGIDAEAEAAKFRDFEFAKPRSDWPATWRNWIRTARDRGTYAKAAAAPGAIQWQ